MKSSSSEISWTLTASHPITKNNLRAISSQTIFKDYTYGNTVLDRWQRLAPKSKFTILEGNHDFRVETLIDACPQLEGIAEVVKGLHLKERGIKWVRYWSRGEIYRVGKASFIHGTFTSQHHAKKHLDTYDASVFYGHVHSVQSYSKVQKKGKPMIGQALGCLCKLDQSYMRGKPSNWVHAIGVFYFRKNGHFNHYVCQLVDSEFTAPNGKIYASRN